MSSNIFITALNTNQKIDLKNNEKVNIYLVSNKRENCNKNLDIYLHNNNEVNLYGLVLGKGSTKIFNFNLHHLGNNSTSNIFVKALANNKAIINVNCVSSNLPKTKKNIINQQIDGLMFDDESIIKALPCLDINVDNVTAKHTVNIGQIDPEIIFYLNTKGLSEIDAYQFMIDSFINELTPYLIQYKTNIAEDIKALMEAKHE